MTSKERRCANRRKKHKREAIRKQITENAALEQSQTAYAEQYDSLVSRYEPKQ